MQTDRRSWLKTIGLVSAGLCLPTLGSFAMPTPHHHQIAKEDDPIRLSSNENPYGPSPMARKAMARHINSSNRYPWHIISSLMSAIAMKNNLAKENVLLGAGSTQIIDAVIQLAALQKGSFVLANPTFSRWSGAAQQAGLQKIEIPLTINKQHDLAAMLRAIRPDTRLVYICNPNNPTGTICDHSALVSFVKEASKQALVMVDEAYLDYTQERSLSSLVPGNEQLIIVKTFSKIYGLAGARIGYALAHANTIERLTNLQSGADVGVSAVSLAGATASLNDTEFVTNSFVRNAQVRSAAIEEMERLNIACIPSHTNFIYCSLAAYKKDFFSLLKSHNIQGTEIFEELGKWSRITVGTAAEMQQFIQAIKS